MLLPAPVGMPILLDRELATRLLQDFRAARTPATLRAYHSDLADFTTFTNADTPAHAVTKLIGVGPGEGNRLVLAYKEHLLASGRAPAPVNRRLAALRSLTRVARLVGVSGTATLATIGSSRFQQPLLRLHRPHPRRRHGWRRPHLAESAR